MQPTDAGRRPLKVPFFRPDIGSAEIDEVISVLQSGWLTTGPRVQRFETEFASAVGSPHAIALNSGTAALHLAVEALGLSQGQAVLVPTMTFAATAEVVRYQGAIPILVDCDPVTLNMDFKDAERKITAARSNARDGAIPADIPVTGMIPVHVGGLMMDVEAMAAFARRHSLWIVVDAAHAFPAAWRQSATGPWVVCGSNHAAVTCFSFYANKTITTGEGGIATTADPALAERIRIMSLHGLSQDAWQRYSGGRAWDYRITAPGYKYNLTDIAAAIGIHQLAAAGEMRLRREQIALRYMEAFSTIEEIELPWMDGNHIHSWHLFPIRLRLERLSTDRNTYMDLLKGRGVGCSVHWRPLHLHPYYERTFRSEDLPVATRTWERLISLPVFSSMSSDETNYVIESVRQICAQTRRQPSGAG